MQRVPIPTQGQQYDVCIGANILSTAAEFAKASQQNGVAVVSDERVWALHGAALAGAFAREGVAFSLWLVPPGEDSKSFCRLETLLEDFAQSGLSRKGLVVAFGGGVVGDLAGFAAASFMRGTPLMQIPTTLLAQVDSSVGGKTAINLRSGKNLAGAFYQPQLVVADTALLGTLPARELACGMAEVIKYGALFSPQLFALVQQPPNEAALPAIVEDCVRLKAGSVQADTFDLGSRMLLNFGHSFGHAVEALGGYSALGHGQAVSIGMVLAAQVGERLGITKAGCHAAIQATAQANGLPTRCPYTADQLLLHMAHDKKGRNGGIDLILLREIGQAQLHFMPFDELQSILREVMQA